MHGSALGSCFSHARSSDRGCGLLRDVLWAELSSGFGLRCAVLSKGSAVRLWMMMCGSERGSGFGRGIPRSGTFLAQCAVLRVFCFGRSPPKAIGTKASEAPTLKGEKAAALEGEQKEEAARLKVASRFASLAVVLCYFSGLREVKEATKRAQMAMAAAVLAPARYAPTPCPGRRCGDRIAVVQYSASKTVLRSGMMWVDDSETERGWVFKCGGGREVLRIGDAGGRRRRRRRRQRRS
eukprot:633513-Rhodomonas_salina.2